MSKGAVALLVSVWFTVAGTGIGLAALINTTTARLDDRITKLAEGQVEFRERITRVETVLGEVRTLAAAGSGLDPAFMGNTALRPGP